ncbi:FtsQ-type POTRA domain-containing protein [Brachyspira innocens]|uniref:FtsQ-type POTRA domain-containing protein n=1 Tax=Brachyspira innocens TaxID=13264 RepID=A0ABT8YU88_9SPIR|nr:FtsQ-type POTRA domain-containing protein [Brachyspira innocens]MDO6993600.1 FtsQ-type POTRA domain-containing protein [Brachyspira innocens]MDO7019299.1 FtsQ-type POTRA domain-containing protein [Brachyspira innocens]
MKDTKESRLKRKLKKNKLTDKQKSLLKRLIAIFVLIIIILVLVLIVNKARILRVEIRGLKRLNAMDIMEEAGLSKYNNTSLFNIPKKDITSDIEKNVRIKVENIRASFPDLLIINVDERDTLFLLESSRGIYEITDDGYIIKNGNIYNYDVPYITGLSITQNSDKVEDEYAKYLASVIYELKKNHNEIYNLISEINAYGDDLILYPRGYQVQVILEKYVKAEKFVDLAAVLKTVQYQSNQTKRIDFRFKEAIIN